MSTTTVSKTKTFASIRPYYWLPADQFPDYCRRDWGIAEEMEQFYFFSEGEFMLDLCFSFNSVIVNKGLPKASHYNFSPLLIRFSHKYQYESDLLIMRSFKNFLSNIANHHLVIDK